MVAVDRTATTSAATVPDHNPAMAPCRKREPAGSEPPARRAAAIPAATGAHSANSTPKPRATSYRRAWPWTGEAKWEAHWSEQVSRDTEDQAGRGANSQGGREHRGALRRVDQDHPCIAGHHGEKDHFACPGHGRSSRSVVGRGVGDSFDRALDQGQGQDRRIPASAHQSRPPGGCYWTAGPAEYPGQSGQDHHDGEHVDPVDDDGRVAGRPGPGAPCNACDHGAEGRRVPGFVRPCRLAHGQPHPAGEPAQPSPSCRNLGRLGQHGLGPLATICRHQRRQAAQRRHHFLCQLFHGQPCVLRRRRRDGAARACARTAGVTAASAAVALASPSGVSRYR